MFSQKQSRGRVPASTTRLNAGSSEVEIAWNAAYAIGTPLSALVTGICCALAIEYFNQNRKDRPRIRLSVAVVVVTTVVGLFLMIDLTYLRLAKGEASWGEFRRIPWQEDVIALLCGICQLICSAYFAYSAYSVATKKKVLMVWLTMLMSLVFLGTFFHAIFGLAPSERFDGAALCPKMTFVWLTCSLLLDCSIAITLLAQLRAPTITPTPRNHSLISQASSLESDQYILKRVSKPRTPLLDRLLTTILTSFSLTAALMFSLLILVLAMHGTEYDATLPQATGMFTGLRLLATPTYAVTFLYTLNRRKRPDEIIESSLILKQRCNLGWSENLTAVRPSRNRTLSAPLLGLGLPGSKHNGLKPALPLNYPPISHRSLGRYRAESGGHTLRRDLPVSLASTFVKLHKLENPRKLIAGMRFKRAVVSIIRWPIHTSNCSRKSQYDLNRAGSPPECASNNSLPNLTTHGIGNNSV